MTDEKKEQLSLDLEAAKNAAAGEKEEPTDSERTLEWTCHPAKKNPKVTAAVTLFIVIIIAVVYYATMSVWFGVLAVLILFGSLTSFYFPTAYKLTEDEIMVKTTTQTLKKKW